MSVIINVSSVSSGGGGGGTGSAVVSSLELDNQTTSIAQASLLSGTTAGMYRVSIDLICTVAGAAGSVSAKVWWNNGTTAATLTTGSPLSLANIGELSAQSGNFYSAAGQAISYSTTVTGGAGAQYTLRIKLEFLGA